MLSERRYRRDISGLKLKAERIGSTTYIVAQGSNDKITGKKEIEQLTLTGIIAACEKAAQNYFDKFEERVFFTPTRPMARNRIKYLTAIHNFNTVHGYYPKIHELAKFLGAKKSNCTDRVYGETAAYLTILKKARLIKKVRQRYITDIILEKKQ